MKDPTELTPEILKQLKDAADAQTRANKDEPTGMIVCGSNVFDTLGGMRLPKDGNGYRIGNLIIYPTDLIHPDEAYRANTSMP